MSRESDHIERLRRAATHFAARGLMDDAAVLTPPSGLSLVLTHDMLVEGVHYLPTDPPADVAWKLVAVNLSDLAAKGATPLGVLTGHTLREPEWDGAFADGLAAALAHFAVPLLGGDTVAAAGPRVLGLTAIGTAPPDGAPARGGAQAGDLLCVAGAIGAAGLGLALARSGADGPAPLIAAYRRPQPLLAEGRVLAPLVHAMTDVSDGLLIDAARMARASGLAVTVDLRTVPFAAEVGADHAARIAAATAGDDYALLAAIPAATLTLCQALVPQLAPIGEFAPGAGLSLREGQAIVALPDRLGYEHDAP